MPKCVLFIMSLFLAAASTFAQEYVYVNTDRLLLRDRPERKYMVYAVFNVPCRLLVEKYENGYKNNKAVTGKFYQVSFSYTEEEIHHYVRGWVEKKYVVRRLNADQDADGTARELAIEVTDGHYPNDFNYRNYPYPSYKGGELSFDPPAPKKVYHIGPRGGCYYINPKGAKVYVDSKLCRESKIK